MLASSSLRVALWAALFGSLVLTAGSGCIISDEADCRSDGDCPAGARCLQSGGIFARDGVCILQAIDDIGLPDTSSEADNTSSDADNSPFDETPDVSSDAEPPPDSDLPTDTGAADDIDAGPCPPGNDDAPCPVGNPCSVGACQDGECVPTPICEGTPTSCGCETCESCASTGGWFDIDEPAPCCSDEGEACLCFQQEFRAPLCNDNGICEYQVTEIRLVVDQCASCPTDTSCDAGECAIDHPYLLAARDLDARLVFGNHFEEALHDRSGGDHHGELRGGALWHESNGPTELLSGYLHHRPDLHSYTEIAHHDDLAPTGTHSIAYWRRRHDMASEPFETDFAKGNDSFQMRVAGDQTSTLRFDLRTGAEAGGGPGQGVTYMVTPLGTMGFDTWQFVIVTFDADTTITAFFVDDMQTPVATDNRTLPITANDLPLTLAGWDMGTADTGAFEMNRFAPVDIAGFALFPIALDADQRQQLLDASVGD